MTSNPSRISDASMRIFCTLAVTAALIAGDIAVRAVHADQNAAAPKLLTAQEFRLVDKDGVAKASLALQPDGSPYIALMDKANNRRITLRIRPEGGSVFAMNDADGKNRIALDTHVDGSATVTVTDRQGKGGAGLLVAADGNAVVVARDRAGAIAFAEPQPEPGDEPAPAKKPVPGSK